MRLLSRSVRVPTFRCAAKASVTLVSSQEPGLSAFEGTHNRHGGRLGPMRTRVEKITPTGAWKRLQRPTGCLNRRWSVRRRDLYRPGPCDSLGVGRALRVEGTGWDIGRTVAFLVSVRAQPHGPSARRWRRHRADSRPLITHSVLPVLYRRKANAASTRHSATIDSCSAGLRCRHDNGETRIQ